MSSTFILASGSPRRRALLASVGFNPEVRPQDIDESPRPDEAPENYVVRIANEKAASAFETDRSQAVLAADTVVTIGGDILQKAPTEDAALETLSRLSGRWHLVHTAVALFGAASGAASKHVELITTRVRFRALSPAEIATYVKSGESSDKAGAYGIQGLGGALVAELRGSYTNVIGLPLEETLALLRRENLIP